MLLHQSITHNDTIQHTHSMYTQSVHKQNHSEREREKEVRSEDIFNNLKSIYYNWIVHRVRNVFPKFLYNIHYTSCFICPYLYFFFLQTNSIYFLVWTFQAVWIILSCLSPPLSLSFPQFLLLFLLFYFNWKNTWPLNKPRLLFFCNATIKKNINEKEKI